MCKRQESQPWTERLQLIPSPFDVRIWPQYVKLSRQDAATAIRQDVLKRILHYNPLV